MSASAANEAFARTAPDVIEIKTLPSGTLLESTAGGDYFANSGRLFRPLFRYIRRHEIAMTTPVESRMSPGAMYFWVSPGEVSKLAGDEDGVRVVETPERRVAAIGGRGGYTKRNHTQAEDTLRAWLGEQTEWVIDGDAHAVFWHGPMTPWFRKQYEVHIPVRPAHDGS